MTPFAVIQRAARLAPELDRAWSHTEGHAWTVDLVLAALYAAGLTLEADVGGASIVKAAQERIARGSDAAA